MHTSTPIKEAVHSSLQQSTREKPLIRAFDLVNLGIDFEAYRGDVWSNSWDMEEDLYFLRRQQMAFLQSAMGIIIPDQPQEEYYTTGKSQLVERLFSFLDEEQATEYNQIKASRTRTIAQYVIDSNSLFVSRIPSKDSRKNSHCQNHLLCLPRSFRELDESIAMHKSTLKIMRWAAEKIFKRRAECKQLMVTFHIVNTYCYPDKPFVIPEKIHQDGSDYVITGIPLILSNVVIPINTVYDTEGRMLVEARLTEAQGLLVDDKALWHGITPLTASEADKTGQRLTIAFDFDCL
ncbi:MAG: 2OG-Fe dioxygenase family protein [Candidatus Melainabacteria bacterium]|nr:2OG-Fe dioxygenase family protein [Candidatus Melainabacteria bacterium]